MSVNLYITDKSSGKSDMHIVCGAAEARDSWVPIFQQLDLAMLQYAFSAGVSLEVENNAQFTRELDAAIEVIEKQNQYVDAVTNIVFRARRLVRLLATHPLDRHDIYIG